MKFLLTAVSSLVVGSSAISVIPNNYVEETLKTKNIETYKTNITTLKVKPFSVDLSNIDDNEQSIKEAIFTEMMIANAESEEIMMIAYSLMLEEQYWTFSNINFEIPKPMESVTYDAKALAKPNHPEYIGVLQFKVTLRNDKFSNVIDFKGEKEEVIVDTKIDKRDRWDGTNGEILVLDLKKESITSKEQLLKNYSTLEISYKFKHEDQAPHGWGTINDYTGTQKINISNLVSHNSWEYPNTINSDNAEYVYDNFTSEFEKNGIIERYRWDYKQNKIWAFYAIDSIYEESTNMIKIRSTSIAGKYRYWGNQAKVHSKVTTQITKVQLIK